MSLAIITMLREENADKWLSAVSSLVGINSKGTAIRLTVSTEFDKEKLNLILSYFTNNLKNVQVYTREVKPFSGTGEGKDRTDYILRILNSELKAVKKEKVCIFDDDITPPKFGLDFLLRTCNNDTKGAVSVYPLRNNPDLAYLHLWPFSMYPEIKDLPNKCFDVCCGGSAFSVWDTKSIKKFIPIKRPGPIVDWAMFIGIKFQENGFNIKCHGKVRCGHG